MPDLNDKQLVVVIEGPSGAGKDSIREGLISLYPEMYDKPINITTREMRPGEAQGNPYFFVDEDKFKLMHEKGDIFEFTMRHGTYRGMSRANIQKVIDDGKIPLIICDLVGIEALQKLGEFCLATIFITADRNEAEQRMIMRGDSEHDRIKRLNDFDNHMQFEKHFDISVANTQGMLDETIKKVHQIIMQKSNAHSAV